MNELCCILSPYITCSHCDKVLCNRHVNLHAVTMNNRVSLWFCPTAQKKMYCHQRQDGLYLMEYVEEKREEDNDI